MKTTSCPTLAEWLWLTPIALLLLGMAGCQQSNRTTVSYMKTLDNSRLQWCIEQIDSGRIRRGMDTNNLQAVFGDSLDFCYEGKAYSFLSAPSGGNDGGVQSPALWKIDFMINPQGIVTDYSLTKAGEK
jgi:hypothetical protein